VRDYDLHTLYFVFFLSISSWLFFSLPTASRDPDKEKNRDWKPHIRKKTDWWAFQNGHERLYCEYLNLCYQLHFSSEVRYHEFARWCHVSSLLRYCNSCKSNTLGEYNSRNQLHLNWNNSNYPLIWLLKS
jgi:hypothetical protein